MVATRRSTRTDDDEKQQQRDNEQRNRSERNARGRNDMHQRAGRHAGGSDDSGSGSDSDDAPEEVSLATSRSVRTRVALGVRYSLYRLDRVESRKPTLACPVLSIAHAFVGITRTLESPSATRGAETGTAGGKELEKITAGAARAGTERTATAGSRGAGGGGRCIGRRQRCRCRC